MRCVVQASDAREIQATLVEIADMKREPLVTLWTRFIGRPPPRNASIKLLRQVLAHRVQFVAFGGPSPDVERVLKALRRGKPVSVEPKLGAVAVPEPSAGVLIREWDGRTYRVEIREGKYWYQGRKWRSLSAIAREITGAHWSGPRFFGLAGSKTT